MNKLQGRDSFDNIVKLYVPSTQDVDKDTDNSQYVDLALTELSKTFGGATCENGIGGWLSKTAGLVKEKVSVVYSYANELSDASINQVVDLAERIKKDMGQEAVSIEVNGKLYFI